MKEYLSDWDSDTVSVSFSFDATSSNELHALGVLLQVAESLAGRSSRRCAARIEATRASVEVLERFESYREREIAREVPAPDLASNTPEGSNG